LGEVVAGGILDWSAGRAVKPYSVNGSDIVVFREWKVAVNG